MATPELHEGASALAGRMRGELARVQAITDPETRAREAERLYSVLEAIAKEAAFERGRAVVEMKDGKGLSWEGIGRVLQRTKMRAKQIYDDAQRRAERAAQLGDAAQAERNGRAS